MMKAYLVGGGTSGTEEYDGVYHLVTADGFCWATQWCSSFEEAMKELYEDRAKLRENWKEKYGSVEVLRLGDDLMTFERLAAREENYTPLQKGQLADGVYFNILTVKNGQWHKSEPRPIHALANLLVDAAIKEWSEG